MLTLIGNLLWGAAGLRDAAYGRRQECATRGPPHPTLSGNTLPRAGGDLHILNSTICHTAYLGALDAIRGWTSRFGSLPRLSLLHWWCWRSTWHATQMDRMLQINAGSMAPITALQFGAAHILERSFKAAKGLHHVSNNILAAYRINHSYPVLHREVSTQRRGPLDASTDILYMPSKPRFTPHACRRESAEPGRADRCCCSGRCHVIHDQLACRAPHDPTTAVR